MNKEQDAAKLKLLLQEAYEAFPPGEFCGLGLILYSDIEGLPVVDLCMTSSIQPRGQLVEQIVRASLLSNPCHDGFHLISLDWKMTKRNQYFAPPINQSLDKKIIIRKNLGARYMSALLGSFLPSVVCTGLISERDGPIIFINGEEK